jgi:hypothetical protein
MPGRFFANCIDQVMRILSGIENCSAFSGYRWTYFRSLGEGSVRSRAETFLTSVDWAALQEIAASTKNGIDCRLLPDIGLGYNHMVRIIQFSDGGRWVARLKLPSLAKHDASGHVLDAREICEFNTMSILHQKTSIPIPKIHNLKSPSHEPPDSADRKRTSPPA